MRSAVQQPRSTKNIMNDGPQTRDYFAEMYVAGILADKGWNIYFPRRDKGFDTTKIFATCLGYTAPVLT